MATLTNFQDPKQNNQFYFEKSLKYARLYAQDCYDLTTHELEDAIYAHLNKTINDSLLPLHISSIIMSCIRQVQNEFPENFTLSKSSLTNTNTAPTIVTKKTKTIRVPSKKIVNNQPSTPEMCTVTQDDLLSSTVVLTTSPSYLPDSSSENNDVVNSVLADEPSEKEFIRVPSDPSRRRRSRR